MGNLTSIERSLDTGRMDRSQFRDVLHSTFDMNDDCLMDRMFRTFDGDADGYLCSKEWLHGIWIFLKGNLVEKATYTFQVLPILIWKWLRKIYKIYWKIGIVSVELYLFNSRDF